MNIWEKYSDMAVQAKASIWYAICSFIQKGISFLVVPIYVRLLSTAEYGEWAVFHSWSSILIIFASLNLYCGVYTKKMVGITDSKERDRYTSCMQGLGTLSTFSLFVVYLFFRDWSNGILGLNTGLMLLLFLYFIVFPAFSFWGTRLRVEYRYKPMVIVTIVMSVLIPVVSIILLYTTDLRAKSLILGYLIVQCLFGFFFYVVQFCKGRCFYEKKYWIYALKFNIPLIPHYLSLIVLGQSDRIMIKHYCGEGDAGVYSFAYQISSAICVLNTAINGSRVPWTYEQLKNKTFSGLRKITDALVVMMAVVVLLVSLTSPEIIWILGTSDYGKAVYVIPVVVLGVYFTFVYDLFASVEFYYGATKYVMYASITGALLNIVLNIIFIPMYGFVAAAYTTLACYLVFMLMHYLFSRKVLKQQNIKTNVYDNDVIFGVSAILGLLCVCCMMTFSCLYIRLFFITVLLGICVMKKSYIKNLLLTMRK